MFLNISKISASNVLKMFSNTSVNVSIDCTLAQTHEKQKYAASLAGTKSLHRNI